MSTIVLNWELGADYGHIGRFLPIAKRLRDRGHRPVCLLRDISRAEEILGGQGIEYLQAPVWLPPVLGLPPDINFTETLFRLGFLQPEGLTAIIRAWRGLWSLLKADLLIMDHSPAANLAARGLGLPRLLIGNSFAIPPKSAPLPRYRWWQQTPAGEPARLNETEHRLLRNINASAMRADIPILHSVSDLFNAEQSLICGWPELDVYGSRDNTSYIGPINNTATGAPPMWPPGDQPRVFAYLKPHYKHFDALMGAMAQSQARFLVFAPGISENAAQRFGRPNILFSATALRMGDVCKHTDFAICHGGGTTDEMLLAGKPLLLLPMQMEQTMTSHRTAVLGAALFLELDGNPGELRRLLKKLLTEPGFTETAQAFEKSHAGHRPEDSLLKLVKECDRLLEESSAKVSVP